VGASHRCPAVKRQCPAHRCGVPRTLDALPLDGVPGTLGRAVGRRTCTLVVGERIAAGTGGTTLAVVGHADHRPAVPQHMHNPEQGSAGQSCTPRLGCQPPAVAHHSHPGGHSAGPAGDGGSSATSPHRTHARSMVPSRCSTLNRREVMMLESSARVMMLLWGGSWRAALRLITGPSPSLLCVSPYGTERGRRHLRSPPAGCPLSPARGTMLPRHVAAGALLQRGGVAP
jgi:hypothetical protein